MAMVGIFFNVFMFFHFLKKEKLSFYVLCTSKTVSNTMSLLIHLCYIGPVQLFYTAIGSMKFGARLQQVFGGGLLLQGPMTQMLITVNRFLVITFSPTTIPRYSTHITVVALAVVWIMGVWWSTLPGFPDHCFNPFFFDHVGYYESRCNQELVVYQVGIIFPLAIFNNGMNVFLAIKLAISVYKQLSISSEVVRNRRKQTIRFFVQSCIQDWATATVLGTNIFLVSFFCEKHTCMILPSFAVDATAYAVDG
ncbi:hypothetical protein CAEBREN_30528 [Caenorhabditis brenneri]|uniref:7TM GPCR serpentine receptor class x (Srx) domain-containing protein n=1 Tax=Caenorhabditis brenneri TaxID=135651 RepID=G0NMV2_CAEBE|nr:hypothetical protein CAEBREN_30528 [Caenorhabditis brenneri]